MSRKTPVPEGELERVRSRVDTLPDSFFELLQKKPPSVGAIIGTRYRLTEHLADGAMGSVWVAENLAINLRVAVKLLKPDLLQSPEFRKRFQQEAQAVAAIDHPNVVRFLDLVVGDPTFLVMEHVQGETLAKVVAREGRLGVERVIAIGGQLCRALEAAHRAGVVHRDLKPANIIITADDTAKIIDFGLAKVGAPSEKQVTRHGQIIGTPEYMAPEQIAGGGKVDARSDVYSTGCVLYELLAGETPFGKLDEVQILYSQIHEEAAPIERVREGLPPALVAVVTRALAKRPEDRFPSAAAMAEALDRAIERRKVPPSPVRARVVIPALATALAVGFVSGLVVTRLRTPAAPAVTTAGAGGATLLLATTPEGASVTVDHQPIAEVTPLALDLPPGPHTLTLARDGHGDLERRLTIIEGHREALYITLPPRTRAVQVATVPVGARIYVDDQIVSKTSPTPVELVADDFHEIRALKSGYEPATVDVAPDDKRAEITITLETARSPRGQIEVTSEDKAEVYIDGLDTGLETPTLGIFVSEGKHSVEIRDSSGRKSMPVTVSVDRGDTVSVSLNLSHE